MLKLLKKTRQDVNGVILITGAAIFLGLITGMTSLQGAEKDDAKDRAGVVEHSDPPAAQPRIPRPSGPVTGHVHSTHDATVRPPTNSVACPDCVTSNRVRHRILHHHDGCGAPKCNNCHNACCSSGHHVGRHPRIHGLIGREGAPLHPHDYGRGRFGHITDGWHAGECYTGTGVTGRHSVERAVGVGCMRISEWPSPCTGLTLTEEQNVSMRAGHCATCQPFCKPAYMNIPDHVWE